MPGPIASLARRRGRRGLARWRGATRSLKRSRWPTTHHLWRARYMSAPVARTSVFGSRGVDRRSGSNFAPIVARCESSVEAFRSLRSSARGASVSSGSFTMPSMIPHTEREAGVPHRHHSLVVLLLAAYVVIGYWGALTLPFINDDYFFLDKIRQASFFDLWKPERLYFQWYRPWSRELHYWFLSRLFVHRELAYHAISFGLWLTVAVLYFRLVERLSGARFTSAVALTGMAAPTLWAGPLFWVAGVQDLWMVLFGLLFLHAVVAGRHLLASLPLALALLSKETAAVLPATAP